MRHGAGGSKYQDGPTPGTQVCLPHLWDLVTGGQDVLPEDAAHSAASPNPQVPLQRKDGPLSGWPGPGD